MADKVDKPKKPKAKSKQDEKGVLAALPSTRPERIGARRGAASRAPAQTTTSAPAASKAGAKSASPAAEKPVTKNAAAKPAAKKTAATKASAPRASAAAKKPSPPRATATRRKAAAPRTYEPTEAAEAAAGAADERAAGAVPRAETLRRPQPVREGAPGIGTSTERDQPSSEHGRPSGVELVGTAVQAAGELAQIGLTIGGQILKRAADRLPKP